MTEGLVAYATPKGNVIHLYVREETNDAAMAYAVVAADEYNLKDLPPLDGWAMDVGAHIGSIAIALAADNPALNVIAIEPLPENVELIRRSAELNHVADRLFIEEAAVGAPGDTEAVVSYYYNKGATEEELTQHRFVGNVFRGQPQIEATQLTVPTVSIAGLAAKYGVKSFCLAVTDCETGEYVFFRQDSEMFAEIRGERHDGGPESIDQLLPAFDVTHYSQEPGIGNFKAAKR